jgi:Zn-dependent protease with chaperone function
MRFGARPSGCSRQFATFPPRAFGESVLTPAARLRLLSGTISDLCHRLRLPIPTVTYDDSAEINAGVTGTTAQDAVVYFSTGALYKLTPGEAAAVAAHELAHIAARDFDEATAGRFYGFGRVPILRTLFDGVRHLRWTFRKRRKEYAADKLAAELVGAHLLISALRKTAGDTPRELRPWLATHPHPRRRIRALRKMARRRARAHAGTKASGFRFPIRNLG